MAERPIIFSAPMVRAIIDGRKSQTRRVVKPQPPAGHSWHGFTIWSTRSADEGKAVWARGESPHLVDVHRVRCPYGQPGDRLWVKETWRPRIVHSCCMDACDCESVAVTYAAGGPDLFSWELPARCVPDEWYMPKAAARGNVSAMFMPRWASRITLEVTGVRVERLQAISEAGAFAEGIRSRRIGTGDVRTGCRTVYGLASDDTAWAIDARQAYGSLWESINGASSWDANPWVWVVEFRRVQEVPRG